MEEGGDEENEEERSREEDRDVSTIHRNGKMGVGIPDAFQIDIQGLLYNILYL